MRNAPPAARAPRERTACCNGRTTTRGGRRARPAATTSRGRGPGRPPRRAPPPVSLEAPRPAITVALRSSPSSSGPASTSGGDGSLGGFLARMPDYAFGIPYALLTAGAGAAAVSLNLYHVSWCAKQRWMAVPWSVLGMRFLWVDAAVAALLLAVNLLSLRRRRRGGDAPRIGPWSPFSVASYLLANVLSSRSAMRLHLNLLVSPSVAAIPWLGRAWLIAGVVVHNVAGWLFLYFIRAGAAERPAASS